MQRRVFLQRSLVGSALLSVFGGGLLALRGGIYPDIGDRELRVLDVTTFGILAAVAARTTLVSAEESLVVAYNVELLLRVMRPAAQRNLCQVLRLLENALPAVLLRSSITPFTRLSPAGQDHALWAWRASSLVTLRGAYQALRRLTLGAYYCQVNNARPLGYRGPRWPVTAAEPMTDRGPLSPAYVPQERP